MPIDARPDAPGPGRRRTRAEARAETRARLLAAAAEVFKRQGYNGASLEAVAEAAGYTKGAVYSNFATKADLFMALLEAYIVGETQAQQAQFAGRPLATVVDSLDQLFQRQVVSDPTWVVLQIEFWLAAVRDPAIKARLLELAGARLDETDEAFHTMLADAGVASPFSGREVRTLLNALATGFAIQWELDPDSVDPALLVRAARRLVGLDPRPGDTTQS